MNYELLCEVLLEVLQDFRTDVKRLQSENNELLETKDSVAKNVTRLQWENERLFENGKKMTFEAIKLRNELVKSQENAKIWYENYDALLQNCEELQSEKINIEIHRNSLQAENNKLILERDELQSKNNDLKKLLKDRGVIVIDDSIVRENNNG